jgi:hypothetical protein
MNTKLKVLNCNANIYSNKIHLEQNLSRKFAQINKKITTDEQNIVILRIKLLVIDNNNNNNNNGQNCNIWIHIHIINPVV